jgi:hypothetical protein
MSVLVGIRSVNEKFEVSLIFVINESFDLRVPRFEYFLTLKVIEVIKHSETRRERNTLE